MKSHITLFLLTVNFLVAQHQTDPCYFDQMNQSRLQNMNLAEQKIRNEISSVASNKNQAAVSNVKIIPVVVHVIHFGGTENISDAQIQSQITILNEDFRKIGGSNGDGNGVDTEIEFCLAKKDPNGKCTNGIVRVNSTLSNHMTYQRTQLSQLSFWDNTRYLNIYIVKTINGSTGALGYASFPNGPANEDGVVIRHNYFGNTGTASVAGGRTATHEVGHWLGLYHTFQGGCGVDTCLDGDYVCDTPPAANPNFGCTASTNSCSNDFPDVPDQIANYMDYSNDNCKSMFSSGQSTRMQATLTAVRNDIWQQWNLDSTGCDSGFVNGPCGPVADFVTLTPNICVGNSVVFNDKSLNDPLTRQWYFTGGTPATSTAASPSVTYSVTGTYTVKIVVSNAQGADSLEWTNYIVVTNPPVGLPLPYSENFETATFPANGITVDNPDGGITWERDTIAIQYSGLASAKINNLINTNYGQADALILPGLDFTSYTGTPYLTYRWAYARSDANYSDEMFVLVSKDCGSTWTQVYYRTGTNLVTGPTQITPYIPDSNTVWKAANINLNTYATFQNVIIKIVNVTDGGNNLYVDNINIGSIALGVEGMDELSGVNVFPNPANENVTVTFEKNNLGGEITLLSVDGRQIKTQRVAGGTETLNVSLQDLENGVYFLEVNIGGKRSCKRLMVVK
jgi:PKD repeat protein